MESLESVYYKRHDEVAVQEAEERSQNLGKDSGSYYVILYSHG